MVIMTNEPIITEEELFTHNCSICGEEFTDRNKYSSYCKPCKREYSKQYYINNKDYYKQYSKQYYNDNKDYYKDYYIDNKEQYKQHNKQYYEDNKDYCKQYNKQYKYKLRHTGYYIYIFCKGNEVQYVGATEGIYHRIYHQHLKGNTHIKDLVLSDEWDNVKYMDLTDIIDDRKELLFIEDYFINKFNPKKNKSLSNIHLADDISKNLLEKVDKLLFNVYYVR